MIGRSTDEPPPLLGSESDESPEEPGDDELPSLLGSESDESPEEPDKLSSPRSSSDAGEHSSPLPGLSRVSDHEMSMRRKASLLVAGGVKVCFLQLPGGLTRHRSPPESLESLRLLSKRRSRPADAGRERSPSCCAGDSPGRSCPFPLPLASPRRAWPKRSRGKGQLRSRPPLLLSSASPWREPLS